ncbi:hypothetical protein ACET3Z_014397 [Daucus carota]
MTAGLELSNLQYLPKTLWGLGMGLLLVLSLYAAADTRHPFRSLGLFFQKGFFFLTTNNFRKSNRNPHLYIYPVGELFG